MQRCVGFKFLSRDLWLMYNGSAMFDLYDRFATLEELFEKTLKNDRESVARLYEVFLILAENGEAARKYMGYDTAPLPDLDELKTLATAECIAKMRDAVVAAIAAGLGREVSNEAEEIDLGLQELNAKKKHT